MEEVLDLLRKYTKHPYIALTARGNDAIMNALRSVRSISERKAIIIPDQGGWLAYLKFPKKVGFTIEEVKTDDGLVDLDHLAELSKRAAALLYENPAGYFADQDISTIYSICNKNGCIVIMDVTGCIGDPGLCDGAFADIMVCSFGESKPVNLGSGGFISTKDPNHYDVCVNVNSKPNSLDNPHTDETVKLINTELDLNTLKIKLIDLPDRLNFLYSRSADVKNDLKSLPIIHRDKKGINVIVSSDDNTKTDIIEYCKSHGLEYTLCPRYIRVLKPAVSIEIKRLVQE